MKRKNKAVAWLLSLCMVSTLLSGVPVGASWNWDDWQEGDEQPIYGLMATSWLDTYWDEDTDSEQLYMKDGYPCDSNGNTIEYTDYTDTSFGGCHLWLDYRATVGGERTHVTADTVTVAYYGDTDPHDNPDATSEPKNGLVSDNPDWEGIVDFMPDPDEPAGYYGLYYNDKAEDVLTIHVDYPEVGFYTSPERSKENLLIDNLYSNLTSYYTFINNANNKIYLNLYNTENRELTLVDGDIQDAEETAAAGDKDTANAMTAFALEAMDQNGEWFHFYGDDMGVYDGQNNFFSVDEIDEDGWYELDFEDECPEISTEEDDDYRNWKPIRFNLRVNVAKTDIWESEDGTLETDQYNIESYFNDFSYVDEGLYAIEKNGDTIYSATSDKIYASLNPTGLSLSFGEAKLDDEWNGTTEKIKFMKDDLSKLTVEKAAELDDDGNPTDWDNAGDDVTLQLEDDGEYVNFAFHVDGNYRISYEGIEGYVYVQANLDGLAFFSSDKRPADGERVENQIINTSVYEGKGGKVYALAWVAPNRPWSILPETMEFKAYVGNVEKPDYIKKGTEVKGTVEDWVTEKVETRLIGYEVEITDQAKEDFRIQVTADRNYKNYDPDTDEFFDDEDAKNSPKEPVWLDVDVINVKEIKIATPPAKTSYTEGEKFDATGMVVNAVYEDGKSDVITNYTVTPSAALKTTDKTVTISYAGKTATQNITVTAKSTGTSSVPKKGTTLKDPVSKATYTVTGSDSKNPTVAYKGTTAKKAKTVKIPATVTIDGVTYKVTSIADNAFKGNKTMTKVTIGSNVKTIGKNAFSGCKKLKTVIIGKNVTTLGANAFKGCTALTKLILPAKLTKIGKNTFNGCKKLKTLTIKSKKLTEKSVANGAFKGLTKKTAIKTPKGKAPTYKKLLKKKGLASTAKVK